MAGGTPESDYTFGQIAIEHNFCSVAQVRECLDLQKKLSGVGVRPKKLGEILVEKGHLTSEQAAEVVRLQTRPRPSGIDISIPGYELLTRIGQGGMGAIYKARQLSMDRIVAIKVLYPKFSSDHNFVQRFLREARAVAKLSHENVISGIDVGMAGNLHYFVMEYVEGETVSRMLKRARIDERKALRVAHQIGRALQHAHLHRLVHRDVKPENIIITPDGTAKLCDLGLAKQTTKTDAALTMDGMSVGTPHYISPEQAR
ncbi:MAG: serine/threonine-protein kinase, partial [Planctomycetota bacterium]